ARTSRNFPRRADHASNHFRKYLPSRHNKKRHRRSQRRTDSRVREECMLDVTGVAEISRIGDITRRHARTRPDRAAIHFEGRRLTYGELDRRTNQVASGLIAEGVGRQRRIAILSKNGPAFFELWFGAAKVDVVLVPVNFRLAAPEVAYVVE